jgi:hypothetical protein
LIDVGTQPLVAVHPTLECQLADWIKHCLLHHPIDDAPCSAAAEDQRVGAFEGLDAVDVVNIAVVLDVVAHAVDKEVR